MDFSEYRGLLKKAITETLQNLAFIQLVEVDNGRAAVRGPGYSQDMLSVYMPVRSEYGVLVMSASNAILEETARNIFALDPDAPVGDDVLNDTISELLNTVSGQFMRSVTPGDEFYELGLPVLGEFDLNGTGGETASCAFETERGEKLFISYIRIPGGER